jgi:ABC-2 type transport system permease protein
MEQLTASKTFEIVSLTTSPGQAREEIRNGRVKIGVVIPPKFHARKLRGTGAQILVLIDGSDSNVSSQALASINGLVAQDNAQVETVGPILSAQPVILFNPAERTANYILPGLAAVVLMMVAVVLSAGAIVRERELGTYEQLLVTPIDPVGLVLGKLGPYLCLGLLETGIVLTLMRFAFQVPIRGSLLFIFAMAVVYLFALLPLGLLISTRAATQMESQQIAQALLIPAFLISGYVFPFEGLPWFLKAIGYLLPTTHMIAILRGVILRNAAPLDLWRPAAALVVISIVTTVLAAKSIRKVAQ